MNTYAYVANNPIKYIDPKGLLLTQTAEVAILAGAGVAVTCALAGNCQQVGQNLADIAQQCGNNARNQWDRMFNDSADDDYVPDGEVTVDDDGTGTVEITYNGPNGPITIIGDPSIDGDTLTIGGSGGAHIDGPGAGTSGLRGTREAGRAIGKKFGVKEVVIQGGERTTGANIGKIPRPVRIPVK